LRNGYAKLGILKQLRDSEEGRAKTVELPGLDLALKRYQRGQSLWWGWIFRKIEGTEGNSSTECKLRAIEAQLLSFTYESKKRLEGLESSLNEWKLVCLDGVNSNIGYNQLANNAEHPQLKCSNSFLRVDQACPILPPLDALSLMLNVKKEVECCKK
jgi:hypothetical protein